MGRGREQFTPCLYVKTEMGAANGREGELQLATEAHCPYKLQIIRYL